MTVLIDPPRWPAHERQWSHLVSDCSLAELHVFARRVGVPRRSFSGDHYDVPQERYADLVAAGAVAVEGRVLLARLVASGLRVPKRRGEHLLASRRVRDWRTVLGPVAGPMTGPMPGPTSMPGPMTGPMAIAGPMTTTGPGDGVLDLIASALPVPDVVLTRLLVTRGGRLLVRRDTNQPPVVEPTAAGSAPFSRIGFHRLRPDDASPWTFLAYVAGEAPADDDLWPLPPEDAVRAEVWPLVDRLLDRALPRGRTL